MNPIPIQDGAAGALEDAVIWYLIAHCVVAFALAPWICARVCRGLPLRAIDGCMSILAGFFWPLWLPFWGIGSLVVSLARRLQ